jgi:hypothetical protein
MSALGQKQTHAVQQKNRYSMSVLGRVFYREQLQRGYFKPRQTGNRRVGYQSASPSAPS